MTGVGWVQWLIDGLFFTAGLLIGALVLHEVQMWRAMRRRGGMLKDFRMASSTVNAQPFSWAWPSPPATGGFRVQPMRREMGVDAPDFGPMLGKPRLEIVHPPGTPENPRPDEADAS